MAAPPTISEEAIAQQMEQQERARESEAQRQQILQRVCHRPALERLARIRLVKKALADKVEDIIVNLAATGRLKAQITEADVIRLLKEQETTETTVTFVRKGKGLDVDLDVNNDDEDFR